MVKGIMPQPGTTGPQTQEVSVILRRWESKAKCMGHLHRASPVRKAMIRIGRCQSGLHAVGLVRAVGDCRHGCGVLRG
jgi:hypothetical protein